MKVPGWVWFLLIALFAVVVGWGKFELATALGVLPGGDLSTYRIDADLPRAAAGALAFVAGLVGFALTLAGGLATWRYRKVDLLSEPLATERQEDGCRLLLRDLRLAVGDELVHVPCGAVTDYSTIPTIGRMLVRWSRVDIAGVVHDWLYEQGPPDWTRARADRIWRDVALSGAHNANPPQAWIAWLALRTFGWIAWHKHRKKTARTCIHSNLN